MLIKSSARLMIRRRRSRVFALIDTESGETVPFFPSLHNRRERRGLLSPVPVVWIEE